MSARPLRAVLWLDARGIVRDNVALTTVVLSVIGTLATAGIGLAADRLPRWSEWFPFVVAVGLVSGPAAFGLLFASLLVEEGETGVRWAITVTPVRPRDLLLVRTLTATVWMCVWPLVSVHLMNATWRVLDLSLVGWLAVIAPLALLTPGFALLIPALARDRVSALAVFKVLSFVSLIPLALFFVPPDAGYRFAFLVSPTGWTVEAFRALFATDQPVAPWTLGALAYAVACLSAALHYFQRNVYRSCD